MRPETAMAVCGVGGGVLAMSGTSLGSLAGLAGAFLGGFVAFGILGAGIVAAGNAATRRRQNAG